MSVEGVDPGPEERPAVPLPVLLVGLSLYLSVYDVASFFSRNEIAASIALMQPYREHDSIFYTYTQNSISRKLIVGEPSALSLSTRSSRFVAHWTRFLSST